MNKIKAWLNQRAEWTCINDENDEIDSCASNKEMICGYVGGFLAIIVAVMLFASA